MSRDQIMRWFSYDHLPTPLKEISRPFCDLAEHIHETLPRCAERTVSLRKVLEGKDAAVRAKLSE